MGQGPAGGHGVEDGADDAAGVRAAQADDGAGPRAGGRGEGDDGVVEGGHGSLAATRSADVAATGRASRSPGAPDASASRRG